MDNINTMTRCTTTRLWVSIIPRVLLIVAVLLPYIGHAKAQMPADIPPTYALMAENAQFQLYVDAESLAFKLVNKSNGYVWHSGLDAPLEGDRLNRSWQAFARSGISIDYFDKRATSSRTSITNAEHSITLTPIEQGFEAQVTFTDYGITVGVNVALEAQGVRVTIPSASIREENADFRLARVYLYPFLGATRGSSVNGYMFLPDGIGSIVRYADSTKAQNMFYGRYYGVDLGMVTTQPFASGLVYNAMPISFPVFGAVHGEGQNALIAIVERGASYGEIGMHPAGIITNFNFIYNSFIYNETYFQATNRSGAGVTVVQRNTNQFDAVVHYHLLSGADADYAGMARYYQRYLVERGMLKPQPDVNPNAGIRLEFLGGDRERVLLWDQFIPMTTLAQTRAILDDLNIPNVETIYYGWQPLGAYMMPPDTLRIEAGLGSMDALQALAQHIAEAGGRLSLYYEPQVALWGEAGYSARYDLALAITNMAMEGFNRHANHYFTLETLQRRFVSLASDIATYPHIHLALDTIGGTLYSDFRQDPPLNREQAITAYQQIFADASVRLGLYRPNDYLWGVTSAYYDMPLSDNGYIYMTESVPFLPMVLAGYLPYYGSVLNFSSNLQTDLLRHVEYGIYPSYFLTHEPTANMLNTRSAWIYTSSYAQWGAHIRESYAWLNALLAPVSGQRIIDHERLAEGVYMTTYANQHRLIVNYNDTVFHYGAFSVAPNNALLLEDES